jgi:hypothetical protein
MALHYSNIIFDVLCKKIVICLVNEWILSIMCRVRVGMEDHPSTHMLLKEKRGDWSSHSILGTNQETLGYCKRG